MLPEGRHHEAGLASESQHQQQPVCLHEGESPDRPSVAHAAQQQVVKQKQQQQFKKEFPIKLR